MSRLRSRWSWWWRMLGDDITCQGPDPLRLPVAARPAYGSFSMLAWSSRSSGDAWFLLEKWAPDLQLEHMPICLSRSSRVCPPFMHPAIRRTHVPLHLFALNTWRPPKQFHDHHTIPQSTVIIWKSHPITLIKHKWSCCNPHPTSAENNTWMLTVSWYLLVLDCLFVPT